VTPRPAGDEEAGEGSRVRPYAMVRGRTQALQDLPVETVLETTDAGVAARLGFEQEKILLHCVRPRGLAEVAAAVAAPLGVVRVLVGDLVAAGLLLLHHPAIDLDSPPERGLLERVLAGLEVL
jgi:hypothetical protein